MNSSKIKKLLYVFLLLTTFSTQAEDGIFQVPNCSVGPYKGKTFLVVVADFQVYWSEFSVLYRAICGNGYNVHIVNPSGTNVNSYGGNVSGLANAESSYQEFTDLFNENFQQEWNPAWNNPDVINVHGSIMDVNNMENYDGLIIVGGLGALELRYDGIYIDTTHELAAERLNQLGVDALERGRVLSAQCHGATVPAYMRVPNTTLQGQGDLGISLVQNLPATGFHLGASTQDAFNELSVIYNSTDRVVVSGPDRGAYESLNNIYNKQMVFSRDWAPQTVAHFARTVLNIAETYPAINHLNETTNVLVFGGDEVHHYAAQGINAATEETLVALLNDPSDQYDINAQAIDCSVANVDQELLDDTDVILMFCHNSFPQSLQNQIVNFVDVDGKSALFLHHAAYNHQNNKTQMINLIGAELSSSASLYNPNSILLQDGSSMPLLDLGHFIGSHSMNLSENEAVIYTDNLPFGNRVVNGRHMVFSFDNGQEELYPGLQFLPGISFGKGVNQINRIFANNATIAGSSVSEQMATGGWSRFIDLNDDGVIGNIVYLQPGESSNVTFSHPVYNSIVKDAIYYLHHTEDPAPLLSNPNTPLPITAYINDSFDSAEELNQYTNQYPGANQGVSIIEANGSLTFIQNQDHSWWSSGTSTFISRPLDGNFVVEVDLSIHAVGDSLTAPSGNFRVAGLMVRSTNPADGDLIFPAIGAGLGGVLGAQTINTDNNNSERADIGGGAYSGILRLCRVGEQYRSYLSTDGGTNWQELAFNGSTNRADLAGTVDVGIAANAYGSGPDAEVSVQHFKVATPNSLEECTSEILSEDEVPEVPEDPTLGITIDFGSNGNPDPNTNVLQNAQLDSLQNLVDSQGQPSGASIQVSGFSGTNSNGSQNPDPALNLGVGITRDSFWGNTTEFIGLLSPQGQVIIGGLNSEATYHLQVFASRESVNDNRSTLYEAQGENLVSGVLNASNNGSQSLLLAELSPNESGEITILISPAEANNNAYGFFYLGGLILREENGDEPEVPEDPEEPVVPEAPTELLSTFNDNFSSTESIANYTHSFPESNQGLSIDEVNNSLTFIQNQNYSWWSSSTSTFISRPLDGNFVVEVDLAIHAVGDPLTAPSGNFRVAGLMVRSTNPADGDWVFPAIGAGLGGVLGAQTLNTNNNSSGRTDIGGGAFSGNLRLCRVGNEYRSYLSTDDGTNWQELAFDGSTNRADLAGVVDVGIAANAYGPGPDVEVQVQYFIVATPNNLDECILPIN